MPSELGEHLNGYDIEWDPSPSTPARDGRSVLVKCASDGAIRAAVHFDNGGRIVHAAVEPSPFGAEAMQVLDLVIRHQYG